MELLQIIMQLRCYADRQLQLVLLRPCPKAQSPNRGRRKAYQPPFDIEGRKGLLGTRFPVPNQTTPALYVAYLCSHVERQTSIVMNRLTIPSCGTVPLPQHWTSG